ncbi:MAG TPA: VanZ family protein [Methylomirabilota bacterium]|nr:VanZ family protein [Methylomirabilota bacterium]
MTTALRFLPPLAWSMVIAWFSGARYHGGATALFIEPWLRALLPWATLEQIAGAHWLLRKTGHVVEYAVLALLWRRALAAPGAPAPWRWPFALAMLTAGLDEVRQALTPTREGRVLDVLLDGSAAAGVLLVATLGARRAADGLARLLLWAAAAGGTLMLAIDLAAAAPSGWLWLSVPAAWIALWVWRRRRARA